MKHVKSIKSQTPLPHDTALLRANVGGKFDEPFKDMGPESIRGNWIELLGMNRVLAEQKIPSYSPNHHLVRTIKAGK